MKFLYRHEDEDVNKLNVNIVNWEHVNMVATKVFTFPSPLAIFLYSEHYWLTEQLAWL